MATVPSQGNSPATNFQIFAANAAELSAATASIQSLLQNVQNLQVAIGDEGPARVVADASLSQRITDLTNAQTQYIQSLSHYIDQANLDRVAGDQAGADRSAAIEASVSALTANLATQIDAAKAAAAGALAALSATVDARRLDFIAPTGRPGDAPLRYTLVASAGALAGPPATLPALPPVLLANGDSGPAVRVTGTGILASREPVALEVGRIYRVRFVVQRRVNPADPAGDTVRCGLVYLDQSMRVISDVVQVRDYLALVTANGRQPLEAVISRTPSVYGQVTAPPSARFAVPVVQFFGPDHVTDCEVLDLADATGSIIIPDLSADIAAQVAALVSEDLDARLQVVEQAIGTPGTVTFQTKGDASLGSIPDSVQVVTLLGRMQAGDGGGGRYVRTAGQIPTGADSFTSHGAVFLREVVAADVAAGVLASGFKTFVAALPTEATATGDVWSNDGRPGVAP